MKAITCNNLNDRGYFRFVDTAKKNSIEVINLTPETWPGFIGRWKVVLDYLNKLDEKEIVIICDSSDVVFLKGHPDISVGEEILCAYHTSWGFFKHFFNVNAGAMISTVKNFKTLAEKILHTKNQDVFSGCDQSLINWKIYNDKEFPKFKETKLIYMNDVVKEITDEAFLYHYVGYRDFMISKTKHIFKKFNISSEDISFNTDHLLKYLKKYLKTEFNIVNCKNVR